MVQVDLNICVYLHTKTMVVANHPVSFGLCAAPGQVFLMTEAPFFSVQSVALSIEQTNIQTELGQFVGNWMCPLTRPGLAGKPLTYLKQRQRPEDWTSLNKKQSYLTDMATKCCKMLQNATKFWNLNHISSCVSR